MIVNHKKWKHTYQMEARVKPKNKAKYVKSFLLPTLLKFSGIFPEKPKNKILQGKNKLTTFYV